MHPTKLELLSFIAKKEPLPLQIIAEEFYNSNFDKAEKDIELLMQDDLVRTYADTANKIRFFELTIKGKEYINTFKQNTFRFWLPLVISYLALVVSIISIFLKS